MNRNTNIKIWDNYNKQWLEPVTLFFGDGGVIWRVDAKIPGENPLQDGWFSIQGDQLNDIAIKGDVTLNNHLLPVDEDTEDLITVGKRLDPNFRFKEMFRSMRFNKKTHLGMGDIRVSHGIQDTIIDSAPQYIIRQYKEWLGNQDEDYALDEIHNFFNKLNRGDKLTLMEFVLKFEDI